MNMMQPQQAPAACRRQQPPRRCCRRHAPTPRGCAVSSPTAAPTAAAAAAAAAPQQTQQHRRRQRVRAVRLPSTACAAAAVEVAPVVAAAADAADAADDGVLNQPQLQAQPAAAAAYEGFRWREHWWPVHALDQLDAARPHAVTLLGQELVLWRDGAGTWRCFEDTCPHRMAPLSEGRLEKGTLQCAYHGWRFEGSSGACVDVPQALDDRAKATACASGRSCVASYPTREECGLVWVWPSRGPGAEAAAAAAPLPLSKACRAAWAEGKGARWYRRELSYSYDMLVENLSDPSHLPFSHHNLTPALKREKGVAMPFRRIDGVPTGCSAEDAAARPRWAYEHAAPLAAFEFPSAMSPGGRVAFSPPGLVTYEYDVVFGGAKGDTLQNDLLAVPVAPGRSLVFTHGISTVQTVTNAMLFSALFTAPKAFPLLFFRAKFQRTPTWRSHLLMNKLFDGDNVFLSGQDRRLAQRSPRGAKAAWTKHYYLPAPADGLVVAARRWMDAALQQPLPTGVRAGEAEEEAEEEGVRPAAAVVTLTREAVDGAAPRPASLTINDRWEQHTKHCTICRAALAELQRRAAAARAVAAAALALAAGLLAGVVAPGLLWGLPPAAAAANALPIAAALAGVLAAVGLVARRVAEGAAQLIPQFQYVEFSHADNH